MCVQVNAATIDGVTPLYNCCASGSVACLELLLQNGAQAHTPHAHFPSALHEACKRGKYHNQTSSKPERSLNLCVCVSAGSSQCVESLLSHGADPDYEVSHLGSPLYVSCSHRHTACSKVLLHRGGSPAAPSRPGAESEQL